MPSIYQPRRPRASPLWQLLTAAWDSFLASYEKKHRPTLGPLRLNVFTAVRNFLRCHCPDCGHERLLAFTCKGRHLCPACHQRRVRQTADWIATAVCHEVPHRQFVFTIPKILRGIFRKRRDLLHLLFKTATETLQEIFRTRLNLPDGKLGAIAAIHTFGDYLIFHPHLHVLAADGLFTPDGRFHCMPAEDLAPAIELFRHRFLHALRDGKHISPSRLADLLSWKHSGFNIHDGGEKPVPSHDTEGRKRLAEYLLRHPFSLQKITWNPTTQTVNKGGALPPGAHVKGTRKPSPSTVRQSILGIQLSPSFGMRPTARPRYLQASKPSATTASTPTKPVANNPSSPTASSALQLLQINNPKSTIINRKSSSSRPRQSKAPAPCVPSGATSSSKYEEPTRSNARAARLP